MTRHAGRIRANCRYLVGVEAEADDLAQEAFISAYFALKGFSGRSSFGTWLGRIKVNRCLNHLKVRRRRVFVDIEDVSVVGQDLRTGPGESSTLDDGDRRRIDAILLEMPETLRVPLILRDMDGLSYQEITEVLDIGLSAVKMRIKRAREAFRTAWAGTVEATDSHGV